MIAVNQITREDLAKRREYCHNTQCHGCDIRDECNALDLRAIGLGISPFPCDWNNKNITEILKATRNYMEQTFIESLEKIVAQVGSCYGVECSDCPLSIFYNNRHCSNNHLLADGTRSDFMVIVEWQLAIAKGEQ